MTLNKLDGKVTVITGGAQGIGRTTVGRFNREGARVIIWDLNEEKGQEIVDIFKETKYPVAFFKVDTTKLKEVEVVAELIFKEYGSIDILINNAGITRDATLLSMTADQWQQVIDLNLTGVFNCTKAIAPYMVKNNYGRIINTSSLAGIYGSYGQTNYAATKSGVVGITKVWARELGRSGVTVNAVTPGFIETDNLSTLPEKIIRTIEEKIPVGRLGKPEDITNAYLFLATEEASYITGTVLCVDGGYVS